MLVLGRRQEETILIGSDIEIKIVGGLHGKQEVKLGITAPRSVQIVRGELPRHDMPEAHLPLIDPEVPPRANAQ